MRCATFQPQGANVNQVRFGSNQTFQPSRLCRSHSAVISRMSG
jgi:hypothetical protein